eukprot:TRINITY_DN16880_c0_g1_i1.p4 TRINITY_DN16880_c0_g1~~TRINITY_DN16880_c0_g1_i1.p4  ORF type:complete len:135 (+),score=21.48 TRINITY_DN16880_c0_g1_i1:172-576(+)
MENDELDALWVVIFDKHNNPVERYKICVRLKYTPGNQFDQDKLRGSFGGTIRKILSTEMCLPELQGDCRFELMITTLRQNLPSDSIWMENVEDVAEQISSENTKLLWNVEIDDLVNIQTSVEQLQCQNRRLVFE